MVSHATWQRRPPNLKRRCKDGVYYYSYQHPISKRETGLGTDFANARTAAAMLNQKHMPDPVMRLVHRVERPKAMFHATADAWLAHWIKDAKPGATTQKDTTWRVGKIKAAIKNRSVVHIDRAELADFLDTIGPSAYPKYRSDLERIFAFAVAKGHRSDNPASGLLKLAKPERRRPRLTVQQYEALHKAASPHLRIAMDLIRLSLQRPGDLCAMFVEPTKVDGKSVPACWDGTTWFVDQGKTGTKLAIRPHPSLRKAILAAVEYRIADCPGLLCYDAPRRAVNHRNAKAYKRHWAQPTEELLTREFTDLFRDRFPTADARPTLYECKSLGAAQYRALGWPEEKVQALAGHADAATTRIYTAGHGHYVPVDLSR